MDKGAVISKCGKFRYRLWRYWGVGGVLVFIMLNPSTADALIDDATIRKCIGFARRHGFDGIEVLNLFAYRATHPADLRAAGYPRGPENDDHIRKVLKESPTEVVFCGWGVNARKLTRPAEVLEIIRSAGKLPMALRLTADGVPCHPLMLPYDVKPVYMPAAV